MTLPKAIETYFAADQGVDASVLTQALKPDATVTGEGA